MTNFRFDLGRGSASSLGLLTIELREDARGATTVRVIGEMDMSNVDVLDARLDALVASGQKRIFVDLRPLKFMDSSGVHLFVDWTHRARDAGFELLLVPGSNEIQRLFEITRTLDHLDFTDSAPANRAPLHRKCRLR